MAINCSFACAGAAKFILLGENCHLDQSTSVLHLQAVAAVHKLVWKWQLLLNFWDIQNSKRWWIYPFVPSLLLLVARSHTPALRWAHKVFFHSSAFRVYLKRMIINNQPSVSHICSCKCNSLPDFVSCEIISILHSAPWISPCPVQTMVFADTAAFSGKHIKIEPQKEI